MKKSLLGAGLAMLCCSAPATASPGDGASRVDAKVIEEARGFMGRSASISFVKIPPILQTDVRL